MSENRRGCRSTSSIPGSSSAEGTGDGGGTGRRYHRRPGLVPFADRRAGFTLIVATGFVCLIEFVAVTTGWPYGAFHYGVALGVTVAGVPVALPLFSFPLVLDPGAVALGFWSYAAGESYYGVPVSNFVGWAVSGTVAVALVEWGTSAGRLIGRLNDCPYVLDDLVSFVVPRGFATRLR